MRYLGLIIFVAALIFTPSVMAAPNATLSTDAARRFVNITVTDLRTVSKVSYLLYYDTNRGQRGLEGGFNNKSKLLRTTRRQILGTCSSGKCVYHQGVKNIVLEATFTLKSGGRTSLTKSLK